MLEDLGRFLCGDETLVEELRLAQAEPQRYCERFGARLKLRGIAEPHPDLPRVALLDGLIERKACVELDWRDEPEELLGAVRLLLERQSVIRFEAPEVEDLKLEQALELVGSALAESGLALAALNHGSDSYALILFDAASAKQVSAWSKATGFGKLQLWRRKPKPKAKRSAKVQPSGVEPRVVARFEGQGDSTWAGNFVALPAGHAAAYDGKTLFTLSTSGIERADLDPSSLPHLGSRPFPQAYRLFRSGSRFGLASRRSVRVWSNPQMSALYEVEAQLAANEWKKFPEIGGGGSSDEANLAALVFGGAQSPTDTVHPVELTLDDVTLSARISSSVVDGKLPVVDRECLPLQPYHRVNPGLFAAPKIVSIARVADTTYAVVRGFGRPPSYTRLVKLASLTNVETLADLGDPYEARISSCGQLLLAAYLEEKPARYVAYRLATPTAPLPIALPRDARLLDYDGGLLWWLERDAPQRFTCVVGELPEHGHGRQAPA
jgi:hypothetical protein